MLNLNKWLVSNIYLLGYNLTNKIAALYYPLMMILLPYFDENRATYIIFSSFNVFATTVFNSFYGYHSITGHCVYAYRGRFTGNDATIW